MGKRKLIIGTIAGALLGAIAMQFDKDTREYTKDGLNKLKENSADILSNPTETVQSIRTAFDKLNANLETGTENTLNALEQVETTLNKLSNKK
ncbi:YtxH domain-containing protein [Oceanobacillus sp. FSL H7-0719]|uniref:YtxH domain-containing protein n=1 Tax=Oceanobacillus sp. FSL H7-0719 TaxID=2954507 RepID=UPI00324F2C97